MTFRPADSNDTSEKRTTENESSLWPAHGEITGPGTVSSHSARIWVRTRQPGKHRFVWQTEDSKRADFTIDLEPPPERDGVTSFVYPDDFKKAPSLPAGARVRYEILDTQGSLGKGRFDTAPEWHPNREDPLAYGGEPFSIAFFSCHQPFEDSGSFHSLSRRALERLPGVLEEFGVCRVIGLGDQMYADMPEGRSLYEAEYFQEATGKSGGNLLDCTPDEVRRFLQHRFRKNFEVDGFSQVIANWATTMICDDHEFVDNFGSDPEHAGKRWRAVREGGLNAVFDYEGLRQHPPTPSRLRSFHFAWEFGPVATFVMDLRSQRFANEEELQFFEQRQLDDLRDYLVAQRDKPLFILGLSIPLAFSPEELVNAGIVFTGEGSDSAERWWNEKAEKNRTQLINLLREHRKRRPDQALLLVGGDVHAGMVSRLDFEDCHAYQMISSALSNRESAFSRTVAEQIPKLGPWSNDQIEWDLMDNQLNGKEDANPYAGLNIGLLTVAPDDQGRIRAVARIVGLSEDDGPRVVFESEPLRGR